MGGWMGGKPRPEKKGIYVRRSTTSKIHSGSSVRGDTEKRNKENRVIKIIKTLIEKNIPEQGKRAYSDQEHPVNAKYNK